MATDIDAAWSDLHDAKPPGWFIGRPYYNERNKEWELHAFDPSEKVVVGRQRNGPRRARFVLRSGGDDRIRTDE